MVDVCLRWLSSVCGCDCGYGLCTAAAAVNNACSVMLRIVGTAGGEAVQGLLMRVSCMLVLGLPASRTEFKPNIFVP